ncbi:MAG: c-type cytochrome [Deltaproteobacteria bacterium]|nr:c-type cytochrome [Deltaproteobacteria bacterium]
MARMKLVLSFGSLALVAGAGAACDDPYGDGPSPNPPPSWGVPITGGTMLATKDNRRAVIADPDRDRVVTVDLDTQKVIGEVAFPGGEPGRLVEDGAGRVHVALRKGNELVAIDPSTGALAFRRAACVEPRGVAWDAATDTVHVACQSGDLASYAAAGGEAKRVLRLERDLRDVVVVNGQLVVSKFRTAELITLDANGAIVARSAPPTVRRFGFGPFGEPAPSTDGKVPAIAAVAWRTIAMPNGVVLVNHQRQVQKSLETQSEGGYGGSCGGDGVVEAAISTMTPGQPMRAGRAVAHGALPVDIALSPAGDKLAVVTAGSKSVHLTRATAPMEEDEDPCEGRPDDVELGAPISDQLGTPTSVAFKPDNTLLIYYPELPALSIRKDGRVTTIRLTGEVGYDSGRAMFHAQTGSGLACASCHPEGGEDGLVWDFAVIGKRRTQHLGGGVMARAPFHWIGDMTTLEKLMNDVFGMRMSGGTPTRSQKQSLGPWLDRVRAPQAPVALDAEAVARGKGLFDDATVGCATCHNGPQLTNNTLVNVGTSGVFKVPSLNGIGARAPFMHDGTAATLHERFGAHGGGDAHGKTSHLTAAQVDDLVAYLNTL